MVAVMQVEGAGAVEVSEGHQHIDYKNNHLKMFPSLNVFKQRKIEDDHHFDR